MGNYTFHRTFAMKALAFFLVCFGAAWGCNEKTYYTFHADTGEDTCYFRVVEHCVNSLANLPESQAYFWTFNQENKASVLTNRTDTGQPILPSNCKDEFQRQLYIFTKTSDTNETYLWYDFPETPYYHAYPFVLYNAKWYQGLKVSVKTFSGRGFITSIDTDKSIVQMEKQPSNTKPFDFNVRWNTTYTLLAIGIGVVFIAVVVILVQACRHKSNDLPKTRPKSTSNDPATSGTQQTFRSKLVQMRML
jgi:hypothetical protein